MSRILIIKPSSLGDIVHAFPVCVELAKRGHEVHFAVRRAYRELVEICGAISQVLDFPAALRDVPAFLSTLRARHYDIVIDLQGLFRSGVAAALTHTDRRIGLPDAREGSLFFYDEVAAYDSSVRHAIERYAAVLQKIDAASFRPSLGQPLDYGLKIPSVALEAAMALTGESDYIVFSPLARQSRKMIRPVLWEKLAEMLILRDETIVVVGQGATMREMPASAINLINRTPLPVLCAILSRAKMCVTVDSAPMHLAAALGAHVVALFGPTDPTKVGPYTTRRMILRSAMEEMTDVTCEGIAAVVLSELNKT